jgi:ligand-binding sensor domain-containing protein
MKTSMTRFAGSAAAFYLLAVGVPAHAQWVHLGNNADIRALHQVGDTLWIGTNGGVVLFDLLDNEVVGRIAVGPSLPSNSVRVIQSDNGRVHVGTDEGLAIDPLGAASVFTRKDDVAYSDIRSISWGEGDVTYLGTYGHGVGKIKDDHVVRITRADSLLSDNVFAVAEIDTGSVYYATSQGLCAYRDSAWVGFQAGAGLPRGQIRQMIEVGKDRFYLLVEGHGAYRFNHNRAASLRADQVFPEGDLAAITLARDGSLWAAGRFGRIARYRNDRWTVQDADDVDVGRARWRCAHTGPDGDLFFGSADGLVVAVQESGLRKIFIPSELPSGYVGSIAEAPDGRTYVGNGPHLLSTAPRSSGFSQEGTVGSVFAVTAARDGQVWLATSEGLARRDGRGWLEAKPDIEPKPPLFVSLTTDASSHLWAGAHTGEVYRFDGQFWVAYAGPNLLRGGPIFRMVIDRRQNVWAFSRAGGAHRWDGGAWTTYPLSDFDSLRVCDATLDAGGRAVAITERGVWRFEADGWKRVLAAGPTEVGRYRAVCFDAAGRMYLGTTEGLALASTEREYFISARDGLQGRDVTALQIDREGNLWVGFRDDGITTIPVEKLW